MQTEIITLYFFPPIVCFKIFIQTILKYIAQIMLNKNITVNIMVPPLKLPLMN